MHQEILFVLRFLPLEQPVQSLLILQQAFHQMVSYFPSVAAIVYSYTQLLPDLTSVALSKIAFPHFAEIEPGLNSVQFVTAAPYDSIYDIIMHTLSARLTIFKMVISWQVYYLSNWNSKYRMCCSSLLILYNTQCSRANNQDNMPLTM